MKVRRLVAVCGPTCSGKTTAVALAPFHHVTCVTTRPMRADESQGSPYKFVKQSEFVRKVVKNEMAEWRQFRGWLYGTEWEELPVDEVSVGAFSPEAVQSLMLSHQIDVKVLWLDVPLHERLRRSVRRDGFRWETIRRTVSDACSKSILSVCRDVYHVNGMNQAEVNEMLCALASAMV